MTGKNRFFCRISHSGSDLVNIINNFFYLVLDKEKLNLQKMILFLTHESITRRGAAAILIKNICFVSDDNSWLLGPSVDILPALLLPLAGGSAIANLDMDDMERLPDDLQFLDESKEREPDSDIRIMLVEAIHLLCNKTEDRKFIRGTKVLKMSTISLQKKQNFTYNSKFSKFVLGKVE